MALLPKERLGEVVAVSFGNTTVTAPQVSDWHVGGGNTQAAAMHAPETVAPDPTPAPPIPEPQVSSVAPPSEEPPVFEIPEDILRAFYQEAIETGLEDGKSQVFAELTVLQERYAAAIEQLRAAGQQLAGQNQTQIIQLACLIAEKVVRGHLKLNPKDLLDMVQEAIAGLQDVGTVTVTCSSGDFEFLQSRLDSMTDANGGLIKVNLGIDEELEFGDFKVETNVGTVDGTVADRVSQVSTSLGGGERV